MEECWLRDLLFLSLQWYLMVFDGFERLTYALPTFENYFMS